MFVYYTGNQLCKLCIFLLLHCPVGDILEWLLLFVQFTFLFHHENWNSFTCSQILLFFQYNHIISCTKIIMSSIQQNSDNSHFPQPQPENGAVDSTNLARVLPACNQHFSIVPCNSLFLSFIPHIIFKVFYIFTFLQFYIFTILHFFIFTICLHSWNPWHTTV